MNICENLTGLIGHTPLFEFKNFKRNYDLRARVIGKLEFFNPGGSSKDRVAMQILEDARRSGRLTPNSVIIDPTSGNMGISLAAAATAMGYQIILTMPESMSQDRQNLLRALGAEIVLTPASAGMAGAIQKANELSIAYPNCFLPSQFSNPSCAAAHEETTGPEIWNDTEGKVDIFVTGVGTGGAITGVGRYLKNKKPNVEIVAVEPAGSPVLSGGKAGQHVLYGLGAGFVPPLLDTTVYDRVMTVEDDRAIQTCREIARLEGLLVGVSSGAVLWAAKRLAMDTRNHGKNIIALLPDGGERYLSTPVFRR